MSSGKIAIVGIGCNFSGGSKSPKKFWDFLKNEGDGVTEVPSNRWSLEKFYDDKDKAPGKMYVKKGAFLEDDVFQFDTNFFGISPRESKTLDPQQRILLETTFEAFEDAGINIDKLKKSKTGVFMGGFMMDNFMLRTGKDGVPEINSHTAVAGSTTLISNRISHAYDLMGPSMTVDTACSSSLVAIHLACQSILQNESELAIAGGVNIMLNPAASIVMSKGKFLAKDGRSKAFFEDADGYGRGEGSGVIVLKKYEEALEAGDRIYAVIDGSAVNQDGRTEGISLPNQEAQIKVIEEVLSKTGIDPTTIDYAEAHGTGTKAGDPLELGALAHAYGKGRTNPLVVGSLKVNIGHTEAAAGVAGVIKGALMLHYGELLPHLNIGKLSSHIPFDELNVKIPLAGQAWIKEIQPKRVAVNSFGYGGTNGHLIMSTVAKNNVVQSTNSQVLSFVISGRSEKSLKGNAQNLVDYLKTDSTINLAALASTLQSKKALFQNVWIIEAANHQELIEGIQLKLEKNSVVNSKTIENPENVWVYTGMGPQWYGMGQELYHSNAIFKSKIDQMDALFYTHSGYSLLAEMLKSKEESRITKNNYAQSANYFVQVALSEVLKSKGMTPDKIVGHSVGEIAAATVAGVITLEEGVRIIYHRGEILEQIAGKGTLLAVGLNQKEAEKYFDQFKGIEVATINSPKSVALAGTKEDLNALNEHLLEKGIFSKFVMVEVAYHSSQAAPLKEQLTTAFSFVQPQIPKIPLYSTVTGKIVTTPIQNGNYWWENVRNQVFFHDTITQIIKDGGTNFIEVGPHPVLGPSVKEISAAIQKETNTFFTLKRLESEKGTIENCMEGILSSGASIALNKDAELPNILLDLPKYAWDKELLWDQSEELENYVRGIDNSHPFLQEQITSLYNSWSFDLNKPSLRYIQDHKVGGTIVFPAAAYIESALSILNRQNNEDTLVINEIEFKFPLSFEEEEFTKVFVEFSKSNLFEVGSVKNNNLSKHVSGKAWKSNKFNLKQMDVSQDVRDLSTIKNGFEAYDYFEKIGLNYGPAFQAIQAYKIQSDAVISLLHTEQNCEAYAMHPSLLDGAFQSLLMLGAEKVKDAAFLPVLINELKLFKSLPSKVLCIGKLDSYSPSKVIGNIQLIDPQSGVVLAEVNGLECKVVQANNASNETMLYKYAFETFDLPTNSKFSKIPLIYSGNEESLQQSIAPLSEVVKEESLSDIEHSFQLVYGLDATFENMESITKQAHKLIAILQNPKLTKKIARLILVMRNGLIDETNYPFQEVNLVSGALVGFSRVVMTELDGIKCTTISINTTDKADVRGLLETSFRDEELIFTNEGWKKGKLVRTSTDYTARSKSTSIAHKTEDYKLDIFTKGKIDTLVFRDFEVPTCKPNEIQIDVQTTSINFKDVMKSMGMLNEAALENTFFGTDFGLEGTGIVSEVGSHTSNLKKGDRVYFFGSGFRSKVNVIEDAVFKLPDHISFEEAATLFVYFTAWSGLVETARLQKGEKVLIHSAAGGVGLSACFIAQSIGAEVYATAGTPEKRAYLRSLGFENVYDSRKLDFYDEILADTQHEGVDVVLNSLAGEVLEKSLGLVKTLGRFVELGKQDITNNNQISLAPFNKSIQFIGLDLDKIMPVDPKLIRRYFENFLASYSSGALQKLPFETFNVSNCQEGFKKLSSGAQIGKVVINIATQEIETAPQILQKMTFEADEAVLITGGCNGFGLRSALWWAEQGVQHLILGSRRGAIPAEELAIKESIENLGTSVYEIVLDVTNEQEVKEALSFSENKHLKLVGIVHAATVLKDAVIDSITPKDFDDSFLPKALGAWNLHKYSAEIVLKYFVCYSSVAAYTGNPGQLAYATSNCFLDALMQHRRFTGKPAMSVSWGSIGEVGILSRNKLVEDHLAKIGLTPVVPAKGLKLLGEGLLNFQNHIGIMDVDWLKWTTSTPGTWERLSNLLESGSKKDMLPIVLEVLAAPENMQEEILGKVIIEIIAQTIGTESSSIELDTKLSDQGLDSIMAVELTVDFQAKLGIVLPVMEILGSGSVGQLVKNGLKKILAAQQIDQSEDDLAERGNLLDYYLRMVFVQKPYFSLTHIEKTEEGLRATAETFHWSKNIGLNVAEAARNLALLGSCIASDANSSPDRHCYPVQYGKLQLNDAAYDLEEGAELEFTATYDSFDPLSSTASANTKVVDLAGNEIATMLIGYHVIPEEGLYEIFKNNINTDPSWQDKNSTFYESILTIDKYDITKDGFIFTIDELKPEHCVGHFDDLPAFPVSTMTRYTSELVRIGTELLFDQQEFKITQGLCETFDFVFAGSKVDFNAQIETIETGVYTWVCNVSVEGKLAAVFTYEINCISSNKINDKKAEELMQSLIN
jgi:acyl transferase domain-containing protein/NADPH:quinone reductase-like Zn-dependent oxidoreductase/acyl carrier protein/NADP-dependent 3-hydroxy acid dehydrogenase YdfG